jgi:hypothetical protein
MAPCSLPPNATPHASISLPGEPRSHAGMQHTARPHKHLLQCCPACPNYAKLGNPGGPACWLASPASILLSGCYLKSHKCGLLPVLKYLVAAARGCYFKTMGSQALPSHLLGTQLALTRSLPPAAAAYPNWAAGIAKRKLPYTFFGPYGPTKACVGDKWPALLCSLKVATPLSPPQFWSKNAGACAGRGVCGAHHCGSLLARLAA